jgi:predicted metal-dependent hydrolase
MRDMTELRIEMNKALNSKDAEVYNMVARQQSKLERRLREYEDQISELKPQRIAVEELQQVHNEELRHLEDSLEDRLRFLEEQYSAPLPAYSEIHSQTTGDTVHMTPTAASVRSSWVLRLLIFLWEAGQRLLRLQLCAGYRRLEWRCVRNYSPYPTSMD